MNDHMLNMIQLIVDLIAFIILFGTWILFYRRSFKDRLTQGIKHMKRYWKLIILTFIVLFILKAIYPELVDLFAPESWKFDETENDKLIEQMFATPFSTFLAFFSIVIIAPINEEFLFRHLLIGELGKKFKFYVDVYHFSYHLCFTTCHRSEITFRNCDVFNYCYRSRVCLFKIRTKVVCCDSVTCIK